MRLTVNSAFRLIAVPGWLGALCIGVYQPTSAKIEITGDSRPASTMVLMRSAQSSGGIVLKAWDKTKLIRTTLVAGTTIRGKCIHCNEAMTFTADHLSAPCSVCPCGSSFASCLVGKITKKVSWQEMLAALTPGSGLRIVLFNPDKPDAGVKELAVDPRTVLLPLDKPLTITDAAFLQLLKPVGAVTEDRAEGGRLVRFTVKDDWNADKMNRLSKILGDQGITVNFDAPSADP